VACSAVGWVKVHLGTGDPCRSHATASQPCLLRSLIKSLSFSSSSLLAEGHSCERLFERELCGWHALAEEKSKSQSTSHAVVSPACSLCKPWGHTLCVKPLGGHTLCVKTLGGEVKVVPQEKQGALPIKSSSSRASLPSVVGNGSLPL